LGSSCCLPFYDLLRTHLDTLGQRKSIEKPEYDFVTHLRGAERTHVEPADVVVIDGIALLLDERVRDLCDVSPVRGRPRRQPTHTPYQARYSPFAGGSSTESSSRYLSTVKRMHLEFVEPSKRYADAIGPARRTQTR